MSIFYSRRSPDEIEDEIIAIEEQIQKHQMQILEIESDIDVLEMNKGQLQDEWDMINDMIEDVF